MPQNESIVRADKFIRTLKGHQIALYLFSNNKGLMIRISKLINTDKIAAVNILYIVLSIYYFY